MFYTNADSSSCPVRQLAPSSPILHIEVRCPQIVVAHKTIRVGLENVSFQYPPNNARAQKISFSRAVRYLHGAVSQHGDRHIDDVARAQESDRRDGRLEQAQRQPGVRAPQTHVRVTCGDDHGVVGDERGVRERRQLVDEHSVRHPTDVVSDRLGTLHGVYQVHSCGCRFASVTTMRTGWRETCGGKKIT